MAHRLAAADGHRGADRGVNLFLADGEADGQRCSTSTSTCCRGTRRTGSGLASHTEPTRAELDAAASHSTR